MVYEIDDSRNVVHLTDFNLPKVVESIDKPDQVTELSKEEIEVLIYINI